jgi:NAD-dependent SIR2 family protein deacetylase
MTNIIVVPGSKHTEQCPECYENVEVEDARIVFNGHLSKGKIYHCPNCGEYDVITG